MIRSVNALRSNNNNNNIKQALVDLVLNCGHQLCAIVIIIIVISLLCEYFVGSAVIKVIDTHLVTWLLCMYLLI